MKFILIAGAVVIVSGIFYFMSTDSTTPVMDDTTTNEVSTMDDTTTEETDVTTNEMPAVDAEVVGETEVMEDTTISTDTTAEADVATTKTFDVSGINFAFDMEEIRVNEGDTVTINFESAEGFHDWVVDEFDAATAQVRPGEGVTSVTFVADKTGTYEYYCSVGSHRANGMVGNLIVE